MADSRAGSRGKSSLAVGRRGKTPVGRLIWLMVAVRRVALVRFVVVLFALVLVGVVLVCWVFADFLCGGRGWRT